jgi:IS1 family transposase
LDWPSRRRVWGRRWSPDEAADGGLKIVDGSEDAALEAASERMTNTHRDIIMRLMVEVGNGCAALANEQMRDLPCERIEVDEIWSYVGKKQMHLEPGNDRRRLGDQWTFVAIDPETKLVLAYRVGKRSQDNAVAFMTDLSERLTNRVQISSDSLRSYVDAVERAFGADVDYGQIVNLRRRAYRAGTLCPAARDRRGAHSDCRNP